MRKLLLLFFISLASAELLGGLLGGLTGGSSGALGGITNTVGGVVSGVTNVLQNVFSELVKVVASLHGHMNGLLGGYKGDPVSLDAIQGVLSGLVGTASPAGVTAANATGDAAEILKLLPTVTDLSIRSELYYMMSSNILKSLLYFHPMLSAIPSIQTLSTADQNSLKEALAAFAKSGDWHKMRAELFVRTPKVGEAIENIYRYYLNSFDKFTHADGQEIQVNFEGQSMLTVIAAMTGAEDLSGIDMSSALARYANLSDVSRTEYNKLTPEVAVAFTDILSGAAKTMSKSALVFKNLPPVLQVDAVKSLISTLWARPVLERAQIAARFANLNAYESLEKLISDVNAVSPLVGAQISPIGDYYVKQLTAKAVAADQIAAFKVNLAGALLQIVQGEVYYKPTPVLDPLGNLLGVSSKIVYGIVNASTGLVTPFPGELDIVGGPLLDKEKVRSRLAGEL